MWLPWSPLLPPVDHRWCATPSFAGLCVAGGRRRRRRRHTCLLLMHRRLFILVYAASHMPVACASPPIYSRLVVVLARRSLLRLDRADLCPCTCDPDLDHDHDLAGDQGVRDHVDGAAPGAPGLRPDHPAARGTSARTLNEQARRVVSVDCFCCFPLSIVSAAPWHPSAFTHVHMCEKSPDPKHGAHRTSSCGCCIPSTEECYQRGFGC